MMKNMLIAIIAICSIAMVGTVSAAIFEKVDLTGVSDVLNDGTLIYAYNIGDTSDTTINGVTFTANDGSALYSPTSTTISNYDDGSPGSAIYNTSGGGIAEFMELFNSETYLASGNTVGSQLGIDLTGLTVGEFYICQLLFGDTRGITHDVDVTVQGDTFAGLVNAGAGYNLLIGFVASSTTETVLFTQIAGHYGSAAVAGYALQQGGGGSYFKKASLVSPPDGDTLVAVSTTVQWAAPQAYVPTGYDVYFGTDPNFAGTAPVLSDQDVTEYDPAGDLANETVYYWRVDAIEAAATTYEGDVWSFTSIPATPYLESQPDSQTVDAGSTAVFTFDQLNATGFQWYKEDVLMPGETSQTLTLTGVDETDEAAYHCVLTNLADPVGISTDDVSLWIKRQVAHWTFDETLTSDVDGWVGVYSDPNALVDVSDDEVYDTNSISGHSLKLAGDGLHVAVHDSQDYFNFYPLGFTISTWVNTTAGDVYGGVVTKQDRITGSTWLGYTHDLYGISAGAYVRGVGSVETAGRNPVNDGKWHHIVASSDGATLSIYIDGKLAGSGLLSGSTDLPSALLIIGAELETAADGTVSAPSPFSGLMDEVEIWTYALDPYDIAHMYTDVMTDDTVCVNQIGLDYDFDGDCQVNLADFAMFASQWLNCNRVPDCK